MSRIESRPSKFLPEGYDFFVDFEHASEAIKACVDELKTICANVQLLSQYGDIACAHLSCDSAPHPRQLLPPQAHRL